MANKRVYIDHLSRVDLFEGFSRRDLENVAKAGDHVTLAAGRTLFKEDQTGNDAFVVLSGSVDVSRNGRKVTTLSDGTILGELAMIDQGPRTATAVCATDCDLLIISRARFRTLLEEVPPMAHKLMATLAGRVRDLDKRSYG